MKSVITVSLMTCLSWSALGGTTQVGSAGGDSSGAVIEYTPRSATVQLQGASGALHICNVGLMQDSSAIKLDNILSKYISVRTSDWKDISSMSFKSTPTHHITKKITGVFETVHSDSVSWDKIVHSAHFHYLDWIDSRGQRSSPTQFVVDVCYRAPQMEYFEDKVNTNFKILSKAKVNAISENTKVQTFLVCDLQGEGDYQWSRNREGQYNTSKNEAVFGLDAQKMPTQQDSKDFFRSSGAVSLTATSNILMDLQLSPESSKAPRFCKIRYVITEEAGEKVLQSGDKNILLSVEITEE